MKKPVLMQFPGCSQVFFKGASLRCARISTPTSQNRARWGPRAFGRAEGIFSLLTRHLFLGATFHPSTQKPRAGGPALRAFGNVTGLFSTVPGGTGFPQSMTTYFFDRPWVFQGAKPDSINTLTAWLKPYPDTNRPHRMHCVWISTSRTKTGLWGALYFFAIDSLDGLRYSGAAHTGEVERSLKTSRQQAAFSHQPKQNPKLNKKGLRQSYDWLMTVLSLPYRNWVGALFSTKVSHTGWMGKKLRPTAV